MPPNSCLSKATHNLEHPARLQIALLYEAVTGQTPDYSKSPAAQAAAQPPASSAQPVAAPSQAIAAAPSQSIAGEMHGAWSIPRL